jgi:predicted molibdopterin-dependent oxidoreductase YjgC
MMQGLMGRAVAVATVVLMASPALAKDGRWDKVEDRIDRAENVIDTAVDRGRWDVAEDKADALEDKFDDAGYEVNNPIDRHERRTWRRILRNN